MPKQAPRPRPVPQRMCVMCRVKMDKRQLTRIVAHPEEGVVVDVTGKKSGRGAYVCSNPVCRQKVLKSSVLDQAIKTTISAAQKEAIMQFWQNHEPQHIS
jgi:uncharacterized protein